MKQYSLKKVETISFFVACAVGVISHFVYDWSGENPVVALFFPVNESTWEHLKLIFYPITLLSLIEYFIFGIQYSNFIFVKFLSVLIGITTTIILFYTYTGVWGKNSDVLNIVIYLLSMIFAYYFSFRMLKSRKLSGVSGTVAYWGFIILLFVFIIFTLFPPKIGLFMTPDF